MLSQDQVEKIKTNLIGQIEASSLQNKKELSSEIKAMSAEELEEFIRQQNTSQQQDCIFCSIAEGKTLSYKIGENAEAVAVLEINPISFGHIIIIPKTHLDKAPASATELAKEISERIKSLKPKSIEVIPSAAFGHGILNILPVYSNETLSSPRKKASEKELQELYKILAEKKEISGKEKLSKSKKPKTKKISEKKMWLPRRMP